MTNPIRPWPYAAKAVVQYEHTATTLQLWVIFRHPMDQTVTPPLAKWIVKVNAVPKTPAVTVWLDAWSLTMVVANIPAHPATVTLEYDGPDPNLITTWRKQWEPWGAIDAGDVPFEWEHVLDVDVPNERVTINGTLILSSRVVTTGIYDDLDVDGINILTLDTSTNHIVIRGFSGGVAGQLLFLVITDHGGNHSQLLHDHVDGDQKLFLHSVPSETLNNEYGGWNLFCDGTSWFDLSHAKHV